MSVKQPDGAPSLCNDVILYIGVILSQSLCSVEFRLRAANVRLSKKLPWLKFKLASKFSILLFQPVDIVIIIFKRKSCTFESHWSHWYQSQTITIPSHYVPRLFKFFNIPLKWFSAGSFFFQLDQCSFKYDDDEYFLIWRHEACSNMPVHALTEQTGNTMLRRRVLLPACWIAPH